MRAILTASLTIFLAGCSSPPDRGSQDAPKIATADNFIDLSKRNKPPSLITTPWDEVVISVPDMDEFSRLFTQIGGFETVQKTDQNWLLRTPGSDSGYIRLVQNNNPNAIPARPLDATSWDSGCYWSMMMRAKNIESIIADAKPLGWEPLTDIAFLEFGPSQLHIVVLRHQITGAQVQLYERLTTPLPEGFTPFERLSRPFNIMQMASNRDAAYDFFQQSLGMETFYYGRPSLSEKEEVMPLGIPPKLTTTVPYKAAIMTPFEGAEYGRFEMIEVQMDGGRDFSNLCTMDNWGVLEVRFTDVQNMGDISKSIQSRNLDSTGELHDYRTRGCYAEGITIKSPDGANINFNCKGR